MRLEYDPAKDSINLAQHGVSLSFGGTLFDDPAHLVVPSARPRDNEDRWKVIGLVDGRCFTAVHVWRETAIRFISVRRSNEGEQRLYSAASRPE
jgi:hypothetical protein